MSSSLSLAEIAGFDVEKLLAEAVQTEAKEKERVVREKKSRADLLPGMTPVVLARILSGLRRQEADDDGV